MELEPGKRLYYKAGVYSRIVLFLTIVAREHGYALGLHGSMHNDLDLIAVPWTENAKPAEELVEAIRQEVGGTIDPRGNNPEDKPHGRRAWLITFSAGWLCIDLSVMPLAPRSELKSVSQETV